MQMAPLSVRLRELQKCRTGMRLLTVLVCMTCQMLQDQSNCKSTDLARVLLDSWMSHSKQCLQVRCSRRRKWCRELDGGDGTQEAKHEVLLPPGTATTTTLAWIETFGRGLRSSPQRGQNLWARLRPSPQHGLCLWARLRPSPQRKADRKNWLLSLDRLVKEDVLILDFFPDEPPNHENHKLKWPRPFCLVRSCKGSDVPWGWRPPALSLCS